MNSEVIKFVAGGGKTTYSQNYLKEHKNGLYLAFNNSVVDDLKKKGYLCRTIDALFASYIIPKLIALLPLASINSDVIYIDPSKCESNMRAISNIKIDENGNLYNQTKKITNVTLYTKNIDLHKMKYFPNIQLLKIIFGKNTLRLTDDFREGISVFLLKNYSDKIIELLQKRFDYIIIDEAQDLKGYREKFAQVLYDSDMKLILLGDDNQNINGGGQWFESLPATESKNESFRCSENVCEWIRNNLQIDIHGTDTIASVNIINKEQVLDYNDGTRCLLYKANIESIRNIVNEWIGPTFTIQGVKGGTLDNDIVILGQTLNDKYYYTALTRTRKSVYTTIKKKQEKLR